jgi:hypothetical protein
VTGAGTVVVVTEKNKTNKNVFAKRQKTKSLTEQNQILSKILLFIHFPSHEKKMVSKFSLITKEKSET